MEALHSVQSAKKKDINFCIICQKDRYNKKKSSTEHGQTKLVTASQILTAGLLDDFNDKDTSSIKYHSNYVF